MGCYGNDEIRTPHLDELAATGTRLENFYTSSPVCSPSRATYLTGKINSQHGVHDWIRRDAAGDMAASFLDGQVTYVDALSANGWTCGLFGKWHLGERELADHGFAYHHFRLYGGGDYRDAPFIRNGEREESKGYVTDVITDEAMAFIRRETEAGGRSTRACTTRRRTARGTDIRRTSWTRMTTADLSRARRRSRIRGCRARRRSSRAGRRY